jgi:ATP-binding cassette, subfamily B, bacterial PglK
MNLNLSILQKIYKLLSKKQTISFFILLIILLIGSVLEIVGIGSIPIFISLLLDPETIIDKLGYINFLYIKEIENISTDKLIFLSSILIIIFFIIKNLFLTFAIYYQGSFVRDIKIELSKKIFENYLSANYLFFLSRNSSIIIRTIIVDIGNSTIFILNIINLLRETLILVSIICLLLIVNLEVAVGLFLFFSIFTFIYYLLTQKKLYSRSKIIQILSSSLLKTVNETIGSIKEIILLNARKKQFEEFTNNISKSEKLTLINYIIKSLPRYFLEFLIVSVMMLIISIYILQGQAINEIIPFLSLIVISALRLVPSFNSISNALSVQKTTLPHLNHMFEEFSILKKINQKKIKKKIELKKSIKLKKINFSYPHTKNKILKNFNIEIQKGQKIGIIGKSGTGKSTLLNIILGLIKPTKGNIHIDDKIINFNNSYWGDTVGYVPQDIYLLDNTIKNNITFGIKENDIDKKLLIDVCKRAQIYDYISHLPKKFETYVGENGHNLSVGQKQRLGIARILYRKPKIIVLDEATSSLDYQNEKKFVDGIFKFNPDLTIIFVSHKISALKKCEKIYDLNKLKYIKRKK